MSIDQIEESFNLGQLFMMSIMQSFNLKDQRERNKKGKVVNKGRTKDERNVDAFRRLR